MKEQGGRLNCTSVRPRAHAGRNAPVSNVTHPRSGEKIVILQSTHALRLARPTDALLVIDMQNDFMPGGPLAVAEGDLFNPGHQRAGEEL